MGQCGNARASRDRKGEIRGQPGSFSCPVFPDNSPLDQENSMRQPGKADPLPAGIGYRPVQPQVPVLHPDVEVDRLLVEQGVEVADQPDGLGLGDVTGREVVHALVRDRY